MNLLLISNSTMAGEEYLSWPQPFILDFVRKNKIKSIAFIPYAGISLSNSGLNESYDIYTNKVKTVMEQFGVTVTSVHNTDTPADVVENSDCIMVGGGNTFFLTYMLYNTGLMAVIRNMAIVGKPYIGWSAGSNMACPTLKTTNDMPIVEPQSFNCLNLIPFQINPHYLDANPDGHGGETRQQRIEEFLIANPSVKVVGLREGSLLHISDDKIELKGSKRLRLFQFEELPMEFNPGENLDFLLK